MNHTVALLSSTVLACGLAGAVAPSVGASSGPATSSSAASCRTSWGSTPEVVKSERVATLTGLRAGRHACFDRLVVDLAGKVRGYDVRYGNVPGASGDGVPLRGTDLNVTFRADGLDEDGEPTYDPADYDEAVDVTGYRTFRHVAYAPDSYGYSTVGLGVRARLPFRVQVVDGPGTGSRLVIDVAHRW